MSTQHIQQAEAGVVIDSALADLIVNKMAREMRGKIANIDPNDDPTEGYDGSWAQCSCEQDDYMDIEGPDGEYEILYSYELAWEYCAWTESWSDPDCTQSFDEIRNQADEVYFIDIVTSDGESVRQDICGAIAKRVNEMIK